MAESPLFQNWDLLVLGIVVIATAMLGFIVYFDKPRSSTRKALLGFTITTAVWGLFNYLSYHVQPPSFAFILLRLTIFAVTWQTYYFLKFSIVFPEEEKFIEKSKLWPILRGIIFLVAILTLTPFVFKEIGSVAPNGTIASVVNGPMIPLFGMTNVGLTIIGIGFLLKKTLRPRNASGKSYFPIGVGVLIMFALIITSNFLLPAFFSNARYIEFGALFVFPFIALTSYAIIKNKIFNVKVVSTELFTAALLILSLLQLIQSQEVWEVIVRSGIFLSLLAVGILLIKSVLIEIQQREELQELTTQLEKANQQLTDLSRFKTQLLSLASHQVKSPLAAIKGYTTIILEGLYGPVSDKVKVVLEKVKLSTNELIKLIDTLLDLRRVEEGKMEYKFEKVPLAKIVTDAVEELRPLAMEKKLSLEFAPPGGTLLVNADAQKLKQVFQNLVDNSIKYTQAPSTSSGHGGFVKVEMKEEPSTNSIVITVSDSGLGIPPDLIPYLFEEFVRDERVKKEIRGTGFGLYIARKIVEAHGGKIQAQSEGEGKGSKFTVRLPRVR